MAYLMDNSTILQGKPRPVATWYKDGQPIDPKMVNVRNSNVDSILFIRSAERDHSGNYELVLQIENMEDRASIEIRVIGEVQRGCRAPQLSQDVLNLRFLLLSEKPGPPRNVRVTDIWGFNAALEWDIPKDDGNSEVTGYSIQKADMKTKVRRG